MFVVGTAGHVDHGKTALIRYLTGIDPDRLQEEKDRGMTIDLGFAWLELPNGIEISLVDVPGHEKFVNNMVAGIGSIDLAMVIVSLEESIMPQTIEHLAILNLLNVQKGIIVLTKKDLVEDEWVELVKSDVEDLVSGTVFQEADIYPVSVKSGEGIADLLLGIEQSLSKVTVRRNIAKPRLPIDRSFTVAGFGTVVTGTLIDGPLSVGQVMELSPSGKEVRIRGLQTHKKSEDTAYPGTRVAANISGVTYSDIKRGEVLTLPNWIQPSEAFDVYLNVLEDIPNPLKHNMYVTLHVGSMEVVAKLRLLEMDSAESGMNIWVQIKPVRSVPILKGDYCVIRSNMRTLGGGVIVATNAKRHKRKYIKTIERLDSLLSDSSKDIVLHAINESEGLIATQEILDMATIELDIVIQQLEILLYENLILTTSEKLSKSQFMTVTSWNSLVKNTEDILSEYHTKYPLRKGAPKEFLRNQLKIKPSQHNEILNMLHKKNILIEETSTIRLLSHSPKLSDVQNAQAIQFVDMLTKDPFSPHDLIGNQILEFLIDQEKVIRLDDKIVFSADVYQEIVKVIKEILLKHDEITVAKLRDEFNTSRKYAVAILDYMDQQQVTKRVGDVRILR